MNDDMIQRGLEAWKVTVQVQQHFNDIEMKIRNYALTLLLAVVAGAGIAIREDNQGLALGVLFAGLIVWFAFYLMDEWWYHRLLLGAVANAQVLEDELSDYVPGIRLSNAIREASAVHVGNLEIRSSWKIRIFYALIAFVLIVGIVAVGMGAWETDKESKSTGEKPQALSTFEIV